MDGALPMAEAPYTEISNLPEGAIPNGKFAKFFVECPSPYTESTVLGIRP